MKSSRRHFGLRSAGLACLSGRVLAQAGGAEAQLIEKPGDPYFERFNPKPAPATPRLALKAGDRLAFCGDSITEARQYTRILETYLTVCVPQLELEFRNCGKSGETAPLFLARMKEQCLRFRPTVATLNYGMNDSGYVPASPERAQRFRNACAAVVRSFQDSEVRVLLGSPGCVGKLPPWDFVREAGVQSDVDLNLNLCGLRDEAVDVARENGVPFADVFWTMFTARYYSLKRRGLDYALCGDADGVHPDWAGHLVMAYAFLRGMELDGNLGEISIDLATGETRGDKDHEIAGADAGRVTVRSTRYPFCADGPLDRHTSIRSGMELVPFQRHFNRLTLRVRGTRAGCRVTWGGASRSFSSADLEQGINLAEEFVPTPFMTAFHAVDELVLAKQSVERDMVWKVFYFSHDEGKIAQYEARRIELIQAIHTAFVPVVHTIEVEAAS